MNPSDRMRLERLAVHLVALGPRAVAEALAELAEHGDLSRLEPYRRLSPSVVAMVGADRFPPRVVGVPR